MHIANASNYKFNFTLNPSGMDALTECMNGSLVNLQIKEHQVVCYMLLYFAYEAMKSEWTFVLSREMINRVSKYTFQSVFLSLLAFLKYSEEMECMTFGISSDKMFREMRTKEAKNAIP